MKSLQKIVVQSTPTIREEVFKNLRNFVISGDAAPGTRLVESRLAVELGASRTPIREALHKLEMEGLVESIPRVGYVVREIEENDVEEIIELRVALETLAAKRACQQVRTAAFKRLERIVLLADKCIAKEDTQGIIACNTEFHEGICVVSGSKRILAINLTLRDHMLRFRNMGSFVPKIARQANADHRGILEAIRKADSSAIESAIRSHLAWTKEDILRKIKLDHQPGPRTR